MVKRNLSVKPNPLIYSSGKSTLSLSSMTKNCLYWQKKCDDSNKRKHTKAESSTVPVSWRISLRLFSIKSVHSLATCQTGTTRWLGTADSHGVLKEVILGRRYSQYNLVDASPSGRSIRVQDFVLSMILQTLQSCVWKCWVHFFVLLGKPEVEHVSGGGPRVEAGHTVKIMYLFWLGNPSLDEVTGEREVWESLLRLQPPWLGPG